MSNDDKVTVPVTAPADPLEGLTPEEREALLTPAYDQLRRDHWWAGLLAAERRAHAATKARAERAEAAAAEYAANFGDVAHGLAAFAQLRSDLAAARAQVAELRRKLDLVAGAFRTHTHTCPECHERRPCPFPARVTDGVTMLPDGSEATVVLVRGCSIEPDLADDDGTPSGSFVVCDQCTETKARAQVAELREALSGAVDDLRAMLVARRPRPHR